MITDDRLYVGFILNGQRWVLEDDEDETLIDPRHEVIARAAARCGAVGLESIAHQLERDGLLQQAGGISYLRELAEIPEANRREAYERGAAEGRAAQAGRLVRAYPPQQTPYDEDGYLELEVAYEDGWNHGAYQTLFFSLRQYDHETAAAVLIQFAYRERPDAEHVQKILQGREPVFERSRTQLAELSARVTAGTWSPPCDSSGC